MKVWPSGTRTSADGKVLRDSAPGFRLVWLGDGVWTEKAQDARTFEFLTDAELVGSEECPLPLAEWEVVSV